ncbi:MAG TPA: putative sulfate exporter family transporter [Gemmatimonadales bacterium]|nr:putative sulfate exporter family transporter [Gemmatimonadales bacterium]
MSAGRRLTVVLFVALAALSLTPWVSPALALAAGTVFALTLGNPLPELTRRLSRPLLQGAVVGLGFGMPLAAVARAGATGIGYTVVGITVALSLGLMLGRWLDIEPQTSFLITAGTSICGGSAIAAVGPAIGAAPEAMSVALATIFVLNGVALYLFPPLGHLLHLSQHQFAVWSALAIHDTSSVVGAASSYGSKALEEATVLKLARALWIVPLSLGAAAGARRLRRRSGEAEGVALARPPLPWFIGLFVAAAFARSAAPAVALPALDDLAQIARVLLVLTLFLIGAGLTRATLRAVGLKPLAQGVLLWFAVGGLTLFAVDRWVRG